MSWNPSEAAARKLIPVYSRIGNNWAPVIASARPEAPTSPPILAGNPAPSDLAGGWTHARLAKTAATIPQAPTVRASVGGLQGNGIPGWTAELAWMAWADHHVSPRSTT